MKLWSKLTILIQRYTENPVQKQNNYFADHLQVSTKPGHH